MHSAQLTIDNSADFRRFFLQAKDEFTGLIVYACSKEEAFRISEKTDDAPGLYILQATDSTLYVGQSKDLAGRIRRHLQTDKIGFERIFVMAKDPSFSMYLDYAEAKLFTMMEDLGLKLEQSNLRGSLPKKEKRLFETSEGRVHAANSWLSQFLSYCIAFGLREPENRAVPGFYSTEPCKADTSEKTREEIQNAKTREPVHSTVESPTSNTTPNEKAPKKPKTRFFVKFPDETELNEPKASDTLVRVLTKIGLENVAALRIACSGRYLVEKTQEPHNHPHVFINGFRIITHSSTDGKVQALEKISQALGIGLEIRKIELPE